MADLDQTPAPPAGEQVHMPEPSLLPILNAFGLAMAIVTVTISHVITALGLILFLVTTVIWIGKARREFSELPAEHGH